MFSPVGSFVLPIQLQINAGAINRSQHFLGYHLVRKEKFEKSRLQRPFARAAGTLPCIKYASGNKQIIARAIH
jgi:hypothetical protein